VHVPEKPRHQVTRADINAHVTIKTEPEVPDEFPPARLFLDDVEEITRILVEATEKLDQDEKSTVKLSIKDQVCDEVQELPKMARKTSNLSVSVTSGDKFSSSTLRIGHSIFLSLGGFTREQELIIFYKLAPIFKRRNLWLRTFVHSHPVVVPALSGLSFAGAVAIVPLVGLLTHKSSMLATTCGLLSMAIFIIILTNMSLSSTVILRHSSEPSALRQGLRDKLPAALIGAVLGSVLTFLLSQLGL